MVDVVDVADPVPPPVEPGEGVLHEVLPRVHAAGQEMGRALQGALPGGEPVVEVEAAGRGDGLAVVPPTGSCCCMRVPVPVATTRLATRQVWHPRFGIVRDEMQVNGRCDLRIVTDYPGLLSTRVGSGGGGEAEDRHRVVRRRSHAGCPGDGAVETDPENGLLVGRVPDRQEERAVSLPGRP